MTHIPSILVVDDDPEARSLIQIALSPEEYQLTFAENGTLALERFFDQPFDLVTLDRMLPDLDGLEVCQRIRQISGVPIIFLTVCGEEEDLIKGFTAGAFDYITKPFRPRELAIRINSLRQHCSFQLPPEGHELMYEGLVVNPGTRQVIRDGQSIQVTPTGYELLVYLMKNLGRPISREELLGNVWRYDSACGDYNFVEAAMARLRHELADNPKDPRYIKTLRGFGYQFGVGDFPKTIPG